MFEDVTVGAPGWEAVGRRRRLVLSAGLLLSGAGASGAFALTQPPGTPPLLSVGLSMLFAILFAWISWGAWTAAAGFLLLRRGLVQAPAPSAGDHPGGDGGRTAILFPICDEDTDRVFAGLEATYRSLAETGRLAAFDIYVLSDSHDPSVWIEEETAWGNFRRAAQGEARLYYRRRRAPAGGKAENIADFCRRWGRLYRYMVVLDADSVMAGPTIARLVDLMNAHPEVGIIQTLPLPVNRVSLFARIRQFASRLYGPLCAAGLHYWQLGDGVYWGHNAILRVEPFMACCGLPRLPGTPPLGGQIMSHDFVEAALIRRAGWTVWLAYGLNGSYEELPPTLPDHLKRDRRWCRGNLQHAKFLWLPGLSFGHRLHFLLGICAYVAAPAWMMFLVAEMLAARVGWGRGTPIAGATLRGEWTILLLIATIATLLFPKVLALTLTLERADLARPFGGRGRCLLSAALETLFSALIGPILMVSYSWFVISVLAGIGSGWGAQSRRDYALTWRDATRCQGGATGLGIVWMAAAAWTGAPTTVEWLAPTLAGLLLSIPVAVYSSSSALGGLARRWRLFLTPEEEEPPQVLREFRTMLEARVARRSAAPKREDGFARAIRDPYVNACHIWQLMHNASDGALRSASLARRALERGPARLRLDEKMAILEDAETVALLHLALWTSPEGITDRRWRPCAHSGPFRSPQHAE